MVWGKEFFFLPFVLQQFYHINHWLSAVLHDSFVQISQCHGLPGTELGSGDMGGEEGVRGGGAARGGNKAGRVLPLLGRTNQSTHTPHNDSKCGMCHQGKAVGIMRGSLTWEANVVRCPGRLLNDLLAKPEGPVCLARWRRKGRLII